MFLLVGGDSEIGAATHRHLKSQGQACAATTRRREASSPERPLLDLAAPLDDWQPPAGTRAACIFAAVARLADCAADPAACAHINVTQTLALVDRLLACGIYVLFLSTNQVFDGETPHVAADAPPSPVSEYGRQKARTEAALRRHTEHGAPAAILRLAKVVSPGMALIGGWVQALSHRQPIRAFHDMMLAPTPADLVVRAIATLMHERPPGIFQLTGPRDVSYAEVGARVAQRLDADPHLVMRVSAASAGMPPGATPRHTTLDSSTLKQRHGIAVPDAWEVLDPMIDATPKQSRS
jgi:dTDP-4-dehydrorhamnose reductase